MGTLSLWMISPRPEYGPAVGNTQTRTYQHNLNVKKNESKRFTVINRQFEAHMFDVCSTQSCPFFCSSLRGSLSRPVSLTQATWQQADTSNHMVVCTDLAMHSLSLPCPPFLPVLLPSLVGYFKPQQAPKPQTTSHNVAAAASRGPAEASEPGALLAAEPEVGGRAGVVVGT